MAATDARPVPRKNAAFRLYFAIRKNDGTLITSWTGADSEVSLDGGAFADCTNEATEIGTSGCGYIDFTAAEMNADSVVYKLTVTNTSALTVVFTLFPEEAGDYRADAVMLSGDATAADNAESFFDGTGYAGTNNVIPTVTMVDGFAANSITAAALATDAVTEIQSGLSTLTAAGVRTAIGLASANLDTQLTAIDDFLDTEIAAIKAKTDNLPTDPADQSAVEAAILSAWTTALTESYSTDGSAPTPAQALMMILQVCTEKAVSGTTMTVKKLDGSTTAFTLTLNDATNPTSLTRAS